MKKIALKENQIISNITCSSCICMDYILGTSILTLQFVAVMLSSQMSPWLAKIHLLMFVLYERSWLLQKHYQNVRLCVCFSLYETKEKACYIFVNSRASLSVRSFVCTLRIYFFVFTKTCRNMLAGSIHVVVYSR